MSAQRRPDRSFDYELYKEVNPFQGTHIDAAAERAIQIAKRIKRKIRLVFNDITLTIGPDSTFQDIVKRYGDFAQRSLHKPGQIQTYTRIIPPSIVAIDLTPRDFKEFSFADPN